MGVQNAVTCIGLGFTGLTICSANIPDKVASAVDSQMDDGIRRLDRSARSRRLESDLGTTGGHEIVETGVGQYLVCKMF